MGLMLEGKVIRRLPSTGGKVIKMITYMEMGDTFDRDDTVDTCRGLLATLGHQDYGDGGPSSRTRLSCTCGLAESIAAVMEIDELPGSGDRGAPAGARA
jgi:hypothetical protein